MYPRPVEAHVIRADPVRVHALGIDLAAPASWAGFCAALATALGGSGRRAVEP